MKVKSPNFMNVLNIMEQKALNGEYDNITINSNKYPKTSKSNTTPI